MSKNTATFQAKCERYFR